MLTNLALTTLLLIGSSQDSQAPQSAAQATVDAKLAATAASAVRALESGGGVYFVGAVSAAKTTEAEDEGAEGGMQIVIGGGGDDADPYRGSFEALLTDKKELLIASIGALPEVVVYDNGTQRLVRTTVADEPVSAKLLAQDLSSLLDLANLAGQIERSTKITERVSAADGSRSFECELSPRTVRAASGGMRDMMAPRVLGVGARIDLDAKGVVTSMELSVLRSDPMAGFRRNALTHVGGGSGSEERVVQMSGGMPKNDEPGATEIYKLRTSPEMPSAHAREALLALRKLTSR